jgi:hypothetical protein
MNNIHGVMCCAHNKTAQVYRNNIITSLLPSLHTGSQQILKAKPAVHNRYGYPCDLRRGRAPTLYSRIRDFETRAGSRSLSRFPMVSWYPARSSIGSHQGQRKPLTIQGAKVRIKEIEMMINPGFEPPKIRRRRIIYLFMIYLATLL